MSEPDQEAESRHSSTLGLRADLYQPHPPGFQQPTQQTVSRTRQPGKSNGSNVLGGVVGLVVVLVGVVGYGVVRGGDAAAVEPAATLVGADGTKPSGPVPPTTEAPATVPEPPVELTPTQRAAADEARTYLDRGPQSRLSLTGLLVSEAGYTTGDAAVAVDSLAVDWNEQAALRAVERLAAYPHSRLGLLEELTVGDSGFTLEEATYGVDSVGADWEDQAVKNAKMVVAQFDDWACDDVLEFMTKHEYFTGRQALHGAEAVRIC